MFRTSKKSTGFTLIELLVVVAIISLLSSIVMASLSSARNKAKDSAIKEELNQVATLMELNYQDYGSYCQIQSYVWIPSDGDCNALFLNGTFSGTYGQKARDLCQSILNNTGSSAGAPYRLLIDTASPSYVCASTYSWDALLNNGNWYCVGSSGAKGEYSSYGGGHPGCYDNP